MKTLSMRASVLLSTVLAITALTVIAKTSPTFEFHTSVVTKAAQSEKGVIVVLTERGDVAAEAAYMLATQIKQNEGFLPLLMVADKSKMAGYMEALSLPAASLPAMIFYNKSGQELGRVIATKPTSIKLGKALQTQNHVG
jgi:spermidine/putrescine-binding protein